MISRGIAQILRYSRMSVTVPAPRVSTSDQLVTCCTRTTFEGSGALTASPVLSILSCAVLMASLPLETWLRFLVWLVIGLSIYGTYSRRHSEFARRAVG